jgi:hypothetical protein
LRDERGEKGGGLTSPTTRQFKVLREMREEKRGVDHQQQENYNL